MPYVLCAYVCLFIGDVHHSDWLCRLRERRGRVGDECDARLGGDVLFGKSTNALLTLYSLSLFSPSLFAVY
jgi:hypothetical protein